MERRFRKKTRETIKKINERFRKGKAINLL